MHLYLVIWYAIQMGLAPCPDRHRNVKTPCREFHYEQKLVEQRKVFNSAHDAYNFRKEKQILESSLIKEYDEEKVIGMLEEGEFWQ